MDSKSYDKTTQNVKDPGRYAFEDAQVQSPSEELGDVSEAVDVDVDLEGI